MYGDLGDSHCFGKYGYLTGGFIMWNEKYDSEHRPTEQNIREFIGNELWADLDSYLKTTDRI